MSDKDDISFEKIDWEKFNLGKRFPEYINKRIFQAMFIVMAITGTIVVVSAGGFNVNYLSYTCPEDGMPCANPWKLCRDNPELASLNYECEFYTNCDYGMCDYDILQPGQTVGRVAPWILRYFELIILAHIVVAFLINHARYHYGRKNKSKD